MRRLADWLMKDLDPSRKWLAVLGLVLILPSGLLILAIIPRNDPHERLLLFLFRLGQIGVSLSFACVCLATRVRGLRWLGWLQLVFVAFLVAVNAVYFWP